MTATFYSVSDPNNKVVKSLGNAKTSRTCHAKGTVDLLHPVIELDYSADIGSCNYCYINTFDRFYYISSYEVEEGRRMTVYLDEDVLMSFSSSILSSNGCAIRWSGGTTDIVDSKYPISEENWIDVLYFPNTSAFGGNGYNYILGVNGSEKV